MQQLSVGALCLAALGRRAFPLLLAGAGGDAGEEGRPKSELEALGAQVDRDADTALLLTALRVSWGAAAMRVGFERSGLRQAVLQLCLQVAEQVASPIGLLSIGGRRNRMMQHHALRPVVPRCKHSHIDGSIGGRTASQCPTQTCSSMPYNSAYTFC